MTELVFRGENSQALTNSLLVAEKFNKEHRDVTKAIRRLLTSAQNCAVLQMFVETHYVNEQNKEQPMFVMNRDGFTLLAMGFTGKKAMQFKLDFINAFNRMESALKTQSFQVPQTFSQALLLAAQQAEQIEAQQKQIEAKDKRIGELEEMTEYTRIVLQSPSTVYITQIAQDYGMSAMKMNATLRDLRIQHKVGNQWILYAKYMKEGYVQSDTYRYTHRDGREDVAMGTKWTQRGRLFIYNELKKKGILPLIESRTANLFEP